MNIKTILIYELLNIVVICQVSTIPPNWVPSSYFQSGNYAIITSATDNNTSPLANHTFTFGTAFSAIPSLAYGTKQYAGNDTFFDQGFLVNSIFLSSSQFQVSVRIMPYTTVLRFGVAYVAIDPQFPHHLNSFDSIPVNYTSGALTNISTQTSGARSFTQIFDYRVLASGRTYTQFTNPTSDFKILLFTSTIQIGGYGYNPVDWSVNWGIINTTHFSVKVDVIPYVFIYVLHFSMIVFNQKDVETGTGYRIIYQTWTTDASGGLYSFPSEFTNSFIMGMFTFAAENRYCGIYYNWQFQASPAGALLAASVVHPIAISWCPLNSMTSNIFYLKSWTCDPPYNYFNLTSELCQTVCANYYTQNTTSYTCIQCLYSCLDCSLTDPNQCTQCDLGVDQRVLINGSCVCIDGTYQNPVTTSICTNCSSNITDCFKCQVVIGPDVVCNECSDGFSLRDSKNCLPCQNYHCLSCSTTSTQCFICNETQQYFLNSTTLECQPCQILNCVECLTLEFCQNCDPNMYLGVNPFTGQCQPCNIACSCDGYSPPSALGLSCLSICGDGLIRVDEQCDDGNNIDLDGCSSTCTIQNYWTCSLEPSCCVFDGDQDFTIKKKSVLKMSYANQLTITFYLIPTNPFLTKIDLTHSISTNLTSIEIDLNSLITVYDPSSQTLATTFTYVSNLQNQTAQFYLDIPKSPNCPTKPVVMQLVKLVDDGNKPIIIYEKEQYQTMQHIQKLMKSVQYISYFLLLLSLLPAKIVGIQLFGVLQLAFFSTANLDYVNLMLVPLMGMKQLNGYNLKLNRNENSVPNRVEAVDYDANFLNNCNIQMSIIFLLIVVGIIMYLLSYVLSKISLIFLKIAKHILKQGLLTLILFNSLNIAYSLGLHFTYANSNDEYYIYGSVLAIIALILPVIITFCLLFTSSKQFGQYKNKFKKGFVSQNYFVVTILYRISLGVYMATNNQVELSTLIIIGFSLGFLLYNLVNLPFKDAYQNYRANICHFSQFIILFITMYYRNMKSSTPVEISAKIYSPAYILLSSLLFCLLISILCLIVQIIKYCKSFLKSNHVKIQNSNTEADINIQNNIDNNEEGINSLSHHKTLKTIQQEQNQQQIEIIV